MSAPAEIHFYDIPSQLKVNAFSPNTWRIRYALNYKKVPYHTIWVEYPEIAPACKKIGAPPTGKKPDGSPAYTVPFIYDPNTDKAISDSINIIQYLENTYPSPPERSLIPPGTWPLQLAFIDAILKPTSLLPLFQFTIPRTATILNEASVTHFREARKARFGGRDLTEVDPKGEERVTEWKKVENGFGVINTWMKDQKGNFLMGDRLIFADLTLVVFVRWIRDVFGEDSEEWRSAKGWHSGRWERLINELEQYAKV
ncbi:hypothetical protein V5O48_010844 [Marasmius crinis-equi]|uniref:GST N-terminal domain-containing protein n=1 Tax=Marasmius crinis-equi TaxID=585013 RepID=A0ABR3F7N2_9AGAR